mmetsp:Transcript_74954/g.217567  ORF Transcript_74954/g.217567 Transcript_74954/m.217567 type:complete len:213 (-) Transcript_74954:657-1295(-)
MSPDAQRSDVRRHHRRRRARTHPEVGRWRLRRGAVGAPPLPSARLHGARSARRSGGGHGGRQARRHRSGLRRATPWRQVAGGRALRRQVGAAQLRHSREKRRSRTGGQRGSRRAHFHLQSRANARVLARKRQIGRSRWTPRPRHRRTTRARTTRCNIARPGTPTTVREFLRYCRSAGGTTCAVGQFPCSDAPRDADFRRLPWKWPGSMMHTR